MTADEFLRDHGDETHVDLINGVVVRQPASHRRQGFVAANVAYRFGRFIDDRDLGWVAINDTFVHASPDTVLGADFLYVSYARVPKGPIPDDLTVPPDIVAETRSPSHPWPAMIARAQAYLTAGVTAVVAVDIETETVSVFRPNEPQQLFATGDELTLPDVLPGFAVPVRQLFG